MSTRALTSRLLRGDPLDAKELRLRCGVPVLPSRCLARGAESLDPKGRPSFFPFTVSLTCCIQPGLILVDGFPNEICLISG